MLNAATIASTLFAAWTDTTSELHKQNLTVQELLELAVQQAKPQWQPMSTAPLDGKHCILAVRNGPFIYSVQGFYSGGKWIHLLETEAQPLAWMPNLLLPEEFLPEDWNKASVA